ncbi:MAG: hypothetical protein AB8B60_00770 [Sulfitobacter sp.]
MTDAHALTQLLDVSQARYDEQRQAFTLIVQEESRLRSELARLTKLDQASSLRQGSMLTMQAIGADVQWQAWLGRSRTTLNMQLARVLALKDNEQAKVRTAFGKVTALQQILAEELTQRKRAHADRVLQRAMDQTVLYRPLT